MQIVGGSSADAPIGASAFLSSRPEEESHEIALFTNPEIRHVAFKVASLAELRLFLPANVLESYRLKWRRTMEPRSPSILMTRTET